MKPIISDCHDGLRLVYPLRTLYPGHKHADNLILFKCASVRLAVMSDSLRPHGLSPTRLLCPWNSPGKKTGVGTHSFLQGIFLTQASNLGSPTLQADSLPTEPPGKPERIFLYH